MQSPLQWNTEDIQIMKKRGRLMAILLSGALFCGIGTGCTDSNTTESAKADYIWSNVYGRVYFCTDGRGIVMGDVA